MARGWSAQSVFQSAQEARDELTKIQARLQLGEHGQALASGKGCVTGLCFATVA
jgi:hypothetical protein